MLYLDLFDFLALFVISSFLSCYDSPAAAVIAFQTAAKSVPGCLLTP